MFDISIPIAFDSANGGFVAVIWHGEDWDYYPISIDVRKKDVIGSLGHPVYVDAESGVEYYGRFEFLDNDRQLLGIAYSNGVVNAVFSDRMLDPRIVKKCGGLDYLGSDGETNGLLVSSPD